MGFIEKSLIPNEEIMYSSNLSKTLTILDTVVFGVFSVITLILSAPFWISVSILAFPLISWIKFSTSSFILTNKRVLIKTGFLNRKSFEILLAKVESIHFDQGIADRIFGVGQITIAGSGGSHEVFKNIENPLEFRRQIQVQIEKMNTTL